MAALHDDRIALAQALRFAAESEHAVVLTAFPGCNEPYLKLVRDWLGALEEVSVLLEKKVLIAGRAAQILAVLALYAGEEWLVTNCWYHEQPLSTGEPEGAYPGAQWKRDLCFRGDEAEVTVFVLHVGRRGKPWKAKYAFRSRLSSLTGRPGNSCIHITDRQPSGGSNSKDVAQERERAVAAAAAAATPQELDGTRGSMPGSMSCDASYAFACARALLHPSSLSFLKEQASGGDAIGSEAFKKAWAEYISWLWTPLDGKEGTELREWKLSSPSELASER